MSAFVTIEGAVKVFRDQKGNESARALDGVDLEVGKGEVVLLIGPSGSGKSTLLRSVNRLEVLDSGSIRVDGRSVTDRHSDLRKIREEAGMVFQNFNLFAHLSVLENICLAPRIVRRKGLAEAKERAVALLARVGLSDKVDSYPRQLSGGQQQRAAIARALAMDPTLLLVDEPTSALDPEMVREVLDVIADLAREGMTMLVVSHEMGFARAAANRIVFMDRGRIVETGTPDELFENAREERTRNFLGHILK